MSERSARIDASVVYSVVVPVYRNASTIPQLCRRLAELTGHLTSRLEVVFVIDGSPDDSRALIERETQRVPFDVRIAELSRNFGSFSAIRAGFAVATGRYIGVLAADLQEPPELMEQFFEALSENECDIAIGKRIGRNDPATSTLASNLYWRFYRRFVLPEMPAGGVDVFACTAEVRDHLVNMREAHTSLIGLLFWLGYRRQEFPYERAARTDGKSGWSFRRKVRYLLDSVFAFTDLPIAMLAFIGTIGVSLSVLVAVVTAVARLTGHIHVSGYTPLLLAVLLMGSLVLCALAVVGSYVWRAYENTKARPVAVVADLTVRPAREPAESR